MQYTIAKKVPTTCKVKTKEQRRSNDNKGQLPRAPMDSFFEPNGTKRLM